MVLRFARLPRGFLSFVVFVGIRLASAVYVKSLSPPPPISAFLTLSSHKNHSVELCHFVRCSLTTSASIICVGLHWSLRSLSAFGVSEMLRCSTIVEGWPLI